MNRRSPALRFYRIPPSLAVAAAILAGAAAMPPPAARAGDPVFVSLGTGELNGIYYPVAKAICQIVNRDLGMEGVRCSPETTPGSAYNIDALRSGELEFAIVQSDVAFAAYYGQGAWSGNPVRGLRSVATLYPELVTIMARANSRIHNLVGLAGRRMNVGSRGSGTRATWDLIETALGWRDGERVRPVELRGDAAVAALCTGAIEANLLIVGHPSPVVRAQEASCPIDFVAVVGPPIDKLVHDHSYYQRGTIGAAIYGMATETPTFGVRATLVTSASMDARVVAFIAKELLVHLPELRTLHPALAQLSARMMIEDGMTAPLHPAAARAYKEFELPE